MVRCFLAISFSAPVKERLRRLQQELARSQANVRWVRPEGLHLTLKFFGNVPPETIPLIDEQAQKVAAKFSPFALGLTNLGAFPSLRRPRVIWVGLEGDLERLKDLQKQLEDAFAVLGFAPETRRFVPHVTLGRVKSLKGIKKLYKLMDHYAPQVGQGWEGIEVNELILYQSTLKPSGAVYTPLALIPLGKANR